MSKALKIVSVIWLVVCCALAVFGIFESHGKNPGGGIASAIALTLLTLPSGFIVQLVYIGVSKLLMASNTNVGLVGDVLLYLVMIAAGYWQWFILLPKAIRKMLNNQSPKDWVLVIIGLIALSYGLYRFYVHAFPGSHLN